jgi:hypothetical protein
MGEVVPRCGAGSLVKIVVRESMRQGVKCVQVGTLSRHRVCESWLCPSARLYEVQLQLKHAMLEGSPVLGATEGEERARR